MTPVKKVSIDTDTKASQIATIKKHLVPYMSDNQADVRAEQIWEDINK